MFVAVLLIDFPGVALLTGLHNHLDAWDAISYLSIAANGYPAHLSYIDAFLPGFPLLVHGLALITRDDVTAAWLVNAVAETVGLWYVFRLVRAERDQASATFSMWLLALAPTALFLIAPFSESTFIAAAAASLYYARAGQSRKAILAGALACAFRLTGLALIPLSPWNSCGAAAGGRARTWLLVLALLLLPLALYSAVHAGPHR